jgi:tetratricopeptide (TPR) repeat protein
LVVYATKLCTNIRAAKIDFKTFLKYKYHMTDRIDILKEYLQKTPADNFLQHALALEYIKVGNDAEARRLFVEILTRDPGYVGSYYHLAQLLQRAKEMDEAIKWYEKGMEEAKKAGEMRAYGELRSAYEELVF